MRKGGKQERQEAIQSILREDRIENQDELLQILSERGFELTQATLSRDFREMKIAKTPDSDGNYFYQLPSRQIPENRRRKQGITSSFSRRGIINIEFSGQFAVIKTPNGYANGIAHDIDSNNIAGIAGTIAGDDTVLVVLRENSDKTDIFNSLNLLFAPK